MSGGPGTCSECQGKFGPGPLCVTCESLVRLRLFVVSGRCPGAVGWFLAQRVRECHRAVLEEAERHWAGQPVRPADPPGLHSTGKAPPQSPPPLASGAGGTGEPEGSPKGTPAKNRVASEGRVAERSTAPEVRESRHRHSSKSRGRKRKRRERSRSRSVPVVAERPETLSSPRVKKEKAESDTPPVAAREESAESEEASLASEASPGAGEELGGPASGSGRAPGDRRARTPSHSPPRPKRWTGPIPAAHHRVRERDPPGKKPKKNKGVKKREQQKRWVRDFGRHHGRDFRGYPR